MNNSNSTSTFDGFDDISDEDLAEVAGGRCGPCRPCGPVVGGGVVVVAPGAGNYTLSTVPTAVVPYGTGTTIAIGQQRCGGGGFRGFSWSWFR